MAEDAFQLVGGDPALDFLNTIHDWTVEDPRDHLPDFAAVLRFGEAAGVVSRAESRRMAAAAGSGEMRRLRELRARLERIFRAAVEGRSPAAADLEAIDREAAEAARWTRLRAPRGGVERGVDVDAAGAATLRARIVEAAVVLLTSPRMARVKACPSCGWFFLDTSKNRSRRWCSMEMCGTSAKARAYYWRTRERAVRSPGARGSRRARDGGA
ncbi:MAG TPA: ABATE domain-containing protein [Gemmatimonadaceae bacterium]